MAGDCGTPTFKLLLVGNNGVGKSTLVKRHLTGEFERKHTPTSGCDIKALVFRTPKGPIRYEVWDTAGQDPSHAGLRDFYYLNGRCAVIMFAVTAHSTFDSVSRWHRSLVRVCGDIPIVVCGNKVDVEDGRQVSADTIWSHCVRNGLKYCDLSAKAKYNMEQPFLRLAKMLRGDLGRKFLATPAITMPEILMYPEVPVCSRRNRAAVTRNDNEDEEL